MDFVDMLLIIGLAFGVSMVVGVYIERDKMILLRTWSRSD